VRGPKLVWVAASVWVEVGGFLAEFGYRFPAVGGCCGYQASER
jgi:hypothetical protein